MLLTELRNDIEAYDEIENAPISDLLIFINKINLIGENLDALDANTKNLETEISNSYLKIDEINKKY